MDKKVDLNYLLSAAVWLDSLLQSYRSFYLTFQSIALAVGIGLLIAIISFNFNIQIIITFITLIGLWILQMFITKYLKKYIINRESDVDFWHRLLILNEQKLPSKQRFFTSYKIHEHSHSQDTTRIKEIFLSDKKINLEQIDLLIGNGPSRNRKNVETRLFGAMSYLWILLILGAIVSICIKAVALL